MNDNYYISWWNLENLFDTSRARARSDKLRRVLRSELDGWTLDVVKRKVAQLAEVIRHMNDGRGPDLMGVCEVENISVLRRLVRAIGLYRGRAVYPRGRAGSGDGRKGR